MINCIDAHAHLCADDFTNDLAQVIEDATRVGVQGALVVAEFVNEFQYILDLADIFPDFCYPCFGIHPVQRDENHDYRSCCLQDFEKALPYYERHHEKLFAIGEIGLDFTPKFIKTPSDKDNQKRVFKEHILIGKRFGLPLNVHSRSTHRHVIAMLKEENAENVLLHAFNGKASVAMEGVQAGYYFSIPPCIVNDEHKQKLVKNIPIEHILLETDSPVLGPDKNVRNEPKNVILSLEVIANIKNISKEIAAHIIFDNTLKLFPRLKKILYQHR